MPIPLIQPLIEEKNKISQEQPWLVFLTLTNVAKDLTLRLVRNTENITYKGEEYIAFPFEIDSIPEATKGTIPTLALKVSNIDRQIQAYVEQDATFGSGWEVVLSLAHISQLNGTVIQDEVAEIESVWESIDVTADDSYLVINLGVQNPMLIQFPRQKFSGGFCQRSFNDGQGCPYDTEGVGLGHTSCKKTLAQCKERFDVNRVNEFNEKIGLPFLAFNGIETRGIYNA
jgi:phage-related protein